MYYLGVYMSLSEAVHTTITIFSHVEAHGILGLVYVTKLLLMKYRLYIL